MLDNTRKQNSSDIAIVGAGLMGMTLARKLALAGHRVSVFEHNEQIGGLNTWHRFGSFEWDRFYHVILPSDRNTLGLVRELGMESHLQWHRTYTGFYVDKKLHSISSNLEFLKFPLLSLFSKFRLAWTMLYASRLNEWKSLENKTVEQWLVQVSGRNNYEKLWKPLLLAKLGECHTRVSAVFIWSYIKRMFSARDKSASAEQLGHVCGGYQSILTKLQQAVEHNGGSVYTNTAVSAVTATDTGHIEITSSRGSERFDQVVCTSPANVLARIVDRSLLDVDNVDTQVEYLGVVCVVLITTQSLSPYYVINIADDTIPFTGVIGMSNVIDPNNTGGYHMTYLPRYMLSTDAEMQQPDEYFAERFVDGLLKMFPEFDSDTIIDIHVTRAGKVQPLQVLHYSQLVPSVTTHHKNLFVLNTSQFVNATLNNNEVVGAVNRFYDSHNEKFARTTGS